MRISYNNNAIDITNFDAVKLSVASPSDISDWSYGEVLKPETINYRTQKPERDGLFCERIFGPVKDINPYDSKFKGIRSREAAVDKNGELVTKSIVRRERMGHISLAVPVTHIWFLRGTPSAMGLLLGMTVKNLERVTYFASYIIKSVDVEKRDQILADKEAEFSAAKEAIKIRYENESQQDGANLKFLATSQTKEIESLTKEFEVFKNQITALDKFNLINETDYRNLSDELRALIKVGMGGSTIKELLDEIDLDQLIKDLTKETNESKGQRKKKLMKRLRLIENMHKAKISPSSLCLSVLPVIPPDLRPMVQLTGGRFATSDLNDLYRRIINRNNRLKKLIDLNAPEVIKRNEQRMLQEAVDALIDNNSNRNGKAVATTGQRRKYKSLSDLLKGKQGRFRQNLLGKRVDYSGRSVIVSGPELKINQCGLPKMMALELFKPFVIGELIACDLAHNIRSATRLIESNENAVWDALDEVIKNKYVLLNRAPSLHRLSVQAFQPVLIEGRAIQLHPLVCKGFNADFDGDQMAVHLPLSQEAQDEARDIMVASHNLLKPADGTSILHIEQDIVLGCYYLTYTNPKIDQKKVHTFMSLDEAIFAYDKHLIQLQSVIRIPYKGEIRQTTLGRFIFNDIFPQDFEFQDQEMTKKQLQSIILKFYNQYGQEKTADIADVIKETGFHYATISGLSIGTNDFVDMVGLDQLVDDGNDKTAAISEQFLEGFIDENERHRLVIEAWSNIDNKIQSLVSDQVQNIDSTMAIAINSGARGDVSQMKKAVGMLGMFSDAAGNPIELPVKSNYIKGLDPLEYFTGTRGNRKALIDIALKTADAGYLTRRLVDVSQDVFTIEDDDENSDHGFTIYREDAEYINTTFAEKIVGRYAAEDVKQYVKKNELITDKIAQAIDQDLEINNVKILSVLSCTNVTGVPRKSYGIDPATNNLVIDHTPIGVIAAQSIGEPGTQLSLNSKHRAGSILQDDTAQGLARIEELFEARNPKGQAFLSEIDGVASVNEDGNNYLISITAKNIKPIKYTLGNHKALVANKSEVAAGDILACLEDNTDKIVAPLNGTVEVTDSRITLIPFQQSVLKYEIPTFRKLLVKDGEYVQAGQRLSAGSVNLQDLLRLQGVESAQRYIMNEVLMIFAGQGQKISSKHLEVIVRQMFSRVQVEDPGDSEFVIGDVVSKLSVYGANLALAKANRKPAVVNQLLLGITKASLSTDSFLSAASFQDTSRVLIAAATSGKVDKLFGLKENVILGRKIPVGTGYKPKEEIEVENLV